MKLNLTMTSPLYRYMEYQDIVPELILFIYNRRFLSLEYKNYAYKTVKSTSSALVTIHAYSFNINTIHFIESRTPIPLEELKMALKRKKIELYGIKLRHQKREGYVNPKEFHFLQSTGISLGINIGEEKYSNIKLDKEFMFIS